MKNFDYKSAAVLMIFNAVIVGLINAGDAESAGKSALIQGY